jgi:hypothetical protein
VARDYRWISAPTQGCPYRIVERRGVHTEPVGTSTHWVERPTEPVDLPTDSVDTPTQWVGTPTEWVDTPTHSVDTSTHWVEKPTDSVDMSTHWVERPTDSLDAHTESVDTSTHSVEPPRSRREARLKGESPRAGEFPGWFTAGERAAGGSQDERPIYRLILGMSRRHPRWRYPGRGHMP